LTCIRDLQLYIFDEPSLYLDIRGRLDVARVIRSLKGPEVYVVCVEHDLAMLDFLSDSICVFYGSPGIFGCVTSPRTVKQGINIFLQGYDPVENVTFMDKPIDFRAEIS